MTLGTLLLTPFLRLFLNNIASGNYWSAILIGDPQGKTSIYPFFPWFFLIGIGFLIGGFYSKNHNKKLFKYGVGGGLLTIFSSLPFLTALDPSNIFGATSQIPISYVVLIFGFFVFLVSLLELIFKNRILSEYNPLVAIGRHVLPIYLITILITLPLTLAFKNYEKHNGSNNFYDFLILEIITLLVVYISALVLARKDDASLAS